MFPPKVNTQLQRLGRGHTIWEPLFNPVQDPQILVLPLEVPAWLFTLCLGSAR